MLLRSARDTSSHVGRNVYRVVFQHIIGNDSPMHDVSPLTKRMDLPLSETLFKFPEAYFSKVTITL